MTSKILRATSAERNSMLGLAPKQKLPPEGMDPRVIDGITVWVTRLESGRGRRKPHRVLALCPKCPKILSAGRLFQHLPVHEETPR